MASNGVQKPDGSVNEEHKPDIPMNVEAQESHGNEYMKKWGFPLSELFRIAIIFQKDKDGTALQLSYENRLKFYSYRRQAVNGPFSPEKFGDVGILDYASKDRKAAWVALGDMSKDEAMARFCDLLFGICPQFTPYVEAHKRDKEEQEKREREEEEEKTRKAEDERLQAALEEEARRLTEEETSTYESQKLQIKHALNQQTQAQFQVYAEQQYPANREQQVILVRQLQEQHYQRYIQQLYQHQMQSSGDGGASPGGRLLQTVQTATQQQQQQQSQLSPTSLLTSQSQENHSEQNGLEKAASDDGEHVIAQARMWTRKDIKEFKEKIKQENDGIIKIGQGETVTVRVPTYEDGKCLFWEFATDHYDVGFGLFFEWVMPETNNVSVLFGDGSDESYESDEDGSTQKHDVEKGDAAEKANKPPIDEIIPIYRRDCHEEVYAGSHQYPGTGVYLLKFDNCYSLWRSKTLYYRVYYTC